MLVLKMLTHVVFGGVVVALFPVLPADVGSSP